MSGDGVHTVRELLTAHNDALRARGLSPASMAEHDPSLDAVPAKGERREIPGRMNLSAGGTMVLAAAPSETAVTLARQAARALGLRVAAVDMFVDIGGDPDAIEVIEVNSNPAIRLLEAIRSRRSDPENLASHLFRHGTAVVFDLPKYGDGICLARMAELLNALDIDRARLQRISVVVTGSNGKGSTAAMCASIGRAYGLRTGLFTSPHLYRFNERIQVDGVEIGDDAFARLKPQVEAAIADISKRLGEQFGAFEALFALACLHFQESECDFAVFEAGIGGRYDPVRLVGARETCVTSVDYEHVELLGNSLELIASDKSDACAAGGTIIYGENCRGLRPHLVEYNRSRGCTPLFVRDDIRIDNEVTAASGQHFDFQFGYHDFRGLETSLPGAFQFNNSAIAVTLFLLWLQREQPRKAADRIETAIRAGLRDARWPGRLEVIQQDPLTVIDVGHTPDGIRQSLASLMAIHGAEDWILVTGASRDKKADEIVGALAPSFDTIICTAAHHKGANAEDIAAAARRANPGADIHVATTIEDAVRLSRELAKARAAKNICRRRAIPGDRICDGRQRRPRGRFEVFLALTAVMPRACAERRTPLRMSADTPEVDLS